MEGKPDGKGKKHTSIKNTGTVEGKNIELYPNGGKGTNPSSQTVKGLDKVTLKDSKYKKSGYVQKGWIDENGNVYECGQEVSELTYLNKGVVILKANWVEVEE